MKPQLNEIESQSYFEKILVPVDGSHTCLHAEELAAQIAKKFGSRVTVVHVVSHELLHMRSELLYQVPSSTLNEITAWFSQKGRLVLSEAVALFREEGVEVDPRIVEYGDPAETTLRIAKTEGYDLVVMGNRGETEVETFSLGSIAEKVSRHAECSVLLVKQKTGLSRILVAVDGSESAVKALMYAVQLAEKHKAGVTLLNVGESRLSSFKPDLVRKVGERVLYEASSKTKGMAVEKRLEFGNPAETVTKVAENEKYNLIILGSRGLSGVKRFLLGSVSDDVSHHAKCSVLIVR